MATTYSQKLRHPKWQKKKNRILERDDYTCQLCGDKETMLHVHHKKYKQGGEPWEVENDDLITYCNHCHRIIESFKEYAHLNCIRIHKKYPLAFCILTLGVIVIRWLNSIPEIQFSVSIDDLYVEIESYKIFNDGEKIH